MADPEDLKKAPSQMLPENGRNLGNTVLTKEQLVASLELEKGFDTVVVSDAVTAAIASVIPQTTLSRADRSRPGAFRIMTTSQAQSAALTTGHNYTNNNNNNNEEDVVLSDDELSFGSMMLSQAIDATVVATAVDSNNPSPVTEVFKAVPLEHPKAQTWPRAIFCIIFATILGSSASLAVAFSLQREQQSMSIPTNEDKNSNYTAIDDMGVSIEESSVVEPMDLFAPFDRITAYMALITIQKPQSCSFNNDGPDVVTIQIECGHNETDVTLYIDEENSMVRQCQYHDDHKRATCDIRKNDRLDTRVVYSCGRRRVDDEIFSSVTFHESVVRCANLNRPPFEIIDTQETILTAIALGTLCRGNLSGLEYLPVTNECQYNNNNNNISKHLLVLEKERTYACIDMRRDDECLDHDCVIGSFGVQDRGTHGSNTLCESSSWEESIFGRWSLEATMASLDWIAFSNKGFADIFAEHRFLKKKHD